MLNFSETSTLNGKFNETVFDIGQIKKMLWHS